MRATSSLLGIAVLLLLPGCGPRTADQTTTEETTETEYSAEATTAEGEAAPTGQETASGEMTAEGEMMAEGEMTMTEGTMTMAGGEISAAEFVEQAAAASLADVRLGEMAAEKELSAEVQDFGRQMVADHRQAGEELKSIAEAQNLEVPDELPAAEEEAVDRLADLSGEEFEREFLDQVVAGHEQAVELFRRASTSTGLGAELQQFASRTLPTLERHLEHARQLHEGNGAT
jgi:putative membrane protein